METPLIITLVIFAVTYILIASEKIDKTIAAVLGACAVIGIGAAHPTHYKGEKIEHFYELLLEKVELEVIFLLIGMMIIVYILSLTGLFEWIAITIAQKSKGNGVLIFVLFMIATAVLSAFLDNVTTIILMAPITILITQILEIPTSPMLIMEAVFSNIGGTATLVGDPPNILIASSNAKLQFDEFIINLGPPVIVIMILGLIGAVLVFRKHLNIPEELKKRVMQAKPEKAITDPFILKRALFVFAFVVLGFFMSRAIHVEPGVIALSGAFIMALVCGVDIHHALAKVEWNTILFFIGLFMLIGALEINGVFQTLGTQMLEVTGGNLMATALLILWFSAIFSAIVDNIPLVIAMIPLIESIVPEFETQMGLTDPAMIREFIKEPLFWSLALGACLGGNGSLIGASANVVAAQVARKNNYKLTFLDFSKYGAPMMFLSLIVATAYVYLRYFG